MSKCLPTLVPSNENTPVKKKIRKRKKNKKRKQEKKNSEREDFIAIVDNIRIRILVDRCCPYRGSDRVLFTLFTSTILPSALISTKQDMYNEKNPINKKLTEAIASVDH